MVAVHTVYGRFFSGAVFTVNGLRNSGKSYQHKAGLPDFPVDGLQNTSSFYRNFAVHLPENPVKRKFLKRHRVGIELGPAAWVADTLATSHMILI